MPRFYTLLSLFICFSAAAQPCLDTTNYVGSATYYQVTAIGNCSFPVPASPVYTVAINPFQYDTAASCGACMQITGPLGSVTASIEDQCPGCTSGSLDLSPMTFAAIADTNLGITTMQWHYVPCPVVGNVNLYIGTNSNPYYIEAQVRNHRYAVSQLEFSTDGSTFTAMARRSDNMFFISLSTAAAGPFTFRITDVLGATIIENNIPFSTGVELAGANQFPSCVVSSINALPEDISIRVHSNPSNNSWPLTVGENLIGGIAEVFDANGKSVYKLPITSPNPVVEFNAVSGVYLLRISSSKSSVVKKLVRL
ncbi:MAG: expansin EXLX1 family cellulose-binding protein [Bacteroidota bacterium]